MVVQIKCREMGDQFSTLISNIREGLMLLFKFGPWKFEYYLADVSFRLHL